MTDPRSPLPDDVEVLLEAERARPDVPRAIRDELYASVMASVGPPGGGGGGGSEGAGAPSGRSPTTVHALFGSRVVVAALSFLAGAGVGAYVRGRAAPTIVAVQAPPPASLSAPAPPPSELVPTIAASALPPVEPPPRPIARASSVPTPPSPASAAAASAKISDINAERALLEAARSALARSDAHAALDAVASHEARHPSGRMREERDALLVQALAAAGRKQEAANRAGRFRLDYPNSIFLPVVDAAVR